MQCSGVVQALLPACREETPATLDFKVMEGSMYNTPPCWAIYMCGLVFNHMLRNGGIDAMQKTNEAKAKVLYDAIDGSDGFYVNPIAKANRSNMNVPFTIPASQELEAVFVKEAAAAGMVRTLCVCLYFYKRFCWLCIRLPIKAILSRASAQSSAMIHLKVQ